MLRFKTLPVMLLSLALTACGASRSPVPLVGTATDVSALAGEWVGDYSHVESGRSGSINFRLQAATDSAFGDVIMIPLGSAGPLRPWRGANMTGGMQAAASTVLTIRFVRVEQGHVSGTLDPYAAHKRANACSRPSAGS